MSGGAAVPRVAAAADAGCVWPLGLSCQRLPVRRLPSAPAVGDTGDSARRHLRNGLPIAALPQRTDRDHRAQLPERRVSRPAPVPSP
jgi:hypothetical protein